jgi:hypothetical protein
MSDFGNIGPLIVDFFVKIKDPLFIIYAPIAGVFAWKAKRYYFVGSTILIFGINLLFAMAFWARPKIPLGIQVTDLISLVFIWVIWALIIFASIRLARVITKR